MPTVREVLKKIDATEFKDTAKDAQDKTPEDRFKTVKDLLEKNHKDTLRRSFDKKDLDEKKLASGTDKDETMKLLEKVVATAMLGKTKKQHRNALKQLALEDQMSIERVINKLEDPDKDENLEKAYVKWVTMYGAKNVDKVTDLSDGANIREVLKKIDATEFKDTAKDAQDKTPEDRFKTVKDLLERNHKDTLRRSFDKKDLDEKKLASGTEKDETMKLLEKVVATAMLGKTKKYHRECTHQVG